jgi:DNA-binding transcriptional ArsR family regulator
MNPRMHVATKFTIEDSQTLLAAPDEIHYLGIFDALCEPIRMQIIRQIASVAELACTTLDETLPISKPTISYHVKILSQAQLISVRKEGRYYHYQLRREVFDYFLPTFLDRLLGNPITPVKPARASRRRTITAPPAVQLGAASQ